MAKKNHAKKALISSLLALFICFTMLIGTTFAWFTDTAVSANNIIKSGNLDVVLEYKTLKDTTWKTVDETTKIFNKDALYEPGYTEVVFLRISNAGSLALKYNLNVNVYGETTSTNVYDKPLSLKDYLEIGYYCMDESLGQYLLETMFGTRDDAIYHVNSTNGSGFTKISAYDGVICKDQPLPKEDGYSPLLVALVLTMPESVGNEANHKTDVAAPTIDLGVSLLATQYTEEEDSFDNQYDKDATLPAVVTVSASSNDKVVNGNTLAAAINGTTGSTRIALGAGEYKMPSIDGNKEVTITGSKDTVIDLTMGAYMDNSTVAFEGVTIKGSTGYANGNGSDYAALYSPNVTYTNCTFEGPFRIGRDGAKFINCTFTNLGNDYVWTYGNDATFEGCTFETEGKALLIYSDGGNEVSKVSVKNCIFNATQGAKAGAISNQNCAAIEISNYGNGVDLTTNGNTYNSNFSGEWRIKTYETGKPKTIVNGTEYTTIALDGKTMTISGTTVTVNG